MEEDDLSCVGASVLELVLGGCPSGVVSSPSLDLDVGCGSVGSCVDCCRG